MVSGLRERHLDVDLRELRLTIGAQVFVAETADDLEIPVRARDHQELLEELRRLRQRVELAGMDAARHEIIARAFRRRLPEDRRFDFPEPVGVEIPADRPRHPMAQSDVLLEPASPQIEIAVPQTHVLGHGRVFGDLKRRRLRLVEHADLAGEDLDLAGRELRVDGLVRAALHHALHADDVLRARAAWRRPVARRRRARRFATAPRGRGCRRR